MHAACSPLFIIAEIAVLDDKRETSMVGFGVEQSFSRLVYMRVLLRQQETGFYLQPSGEWSKSRETAREFANSVVAFWWAKEQQLLGTEVLLAFANPQNDFVSMRT